MAENNNGTSDILRVFKAVKENIMQTLSVSSLCIVKTDTSDFKRCELVNKPNTIIECYDGVGDCVKGDYVMVIYTDEDTRSNIIRIKENQDPVEIPHTNIRHSLNFGIIISKINGLRGE